MSERVSECRVNDTCASDKREGGSLCFIHADIIGSFDFLG